MGAWGFGIGPCLRGAVGGQLTHEEPGTPARPPFPHRAPGGNSLAGTTGALRARKSRTWLSPAAARKAGGLGCWRLGGEGALRQVPRSRGGMRDMAQMGTSRLAWP